MDQSAFLLKEVLQWACQRVLRAPIVNFLTIARRHPSITEPNKLGREIWQDANRDSDAN
jgi:hypothetical protein